MEEKKERRKERKKERKNGKHRNDPNKHNPNLALVVSLFQVLLQGFFLQHLFGLEKVKRKQVVNIYSTVNKTRKVETKDLFIYWRFIIAQSTAQGHLRAFH